MNHTMSQIFSQTIFNINILNQGTLFMFHLKCVGIYVEVYYLSVF